MRIRIISQEDGQARIVNAETGEELDLHVVSIRLEMRATEPNRAWLEVFDVEVDAGVEAEHVEVRSEAGVIAHLVPPE